MHPPWNDEYNTIASLEMLSPPSDTMPADAPTYDTRKKVPHVTGDNSPLVQSLVATHQYIDNASLQLKVVEQDISLDDQYSPQTSHLSSGPLDLSGKEQWNISNMTCPVIGYEDWLPMARTEASHTLQDDNEDQNIFPDDFDLVTIDSMALNHAALDADLSTYLNHSGSAPWDQISGRDTQNPGCSQAALPESTALPIEASTLNVGISEPQSPGIFSRMPSLLKETPRKTLAPPIIDENAYNAIMTRVRLQIPTTTEMEPLISLQEMQQFLKCYLICFHKHCPIVHLPSLDLTTIPCHLILAMCAIGALYRLRRKTAHKLWQCADRICDKVLQDGLANF